MLATDQRKYIEADQTINDEEVDVPINHYPSLMNQRPSKRLHICLRLLLAFIVIFLLLTICLCFVYASKRHSGFYWLGVGLVFLSGISALKLHWMDSMDWDNKVKWATILQGAAVIFLCMGLMAVMYGPKLKEQIQCSASTEAVYYIGGYISGLEYPGLMLGTHGTPISALATTFTLATPYPVGSSYTVAVIQQPYTNGDPSKQIQYCRVTNPYGMMVHANVTSIAVKCDYQKN